MEYISTRGAAPTLDFEGVLLAGLARDGGLYVPELWPRLTPNDLRALRGAPYAEVATRVIQPFVGDAIPEDTLRALIADAYAPFAHRAITPLVQVDQGLWLLELFHGPTLAFKDVALQLLGRLLDHALTARGTRATVVGATSGDTGSAALEACAGRERLTIVILYPDGRTSAVQRRQMTTVTAANAHAVAVAGTFDDCQDAVKGMFADGPFRDALSLTAVNSINWARIVAQVAYYVAAGVALGAPDRSVAFAVPTGNFGNVYAAYAARAMGLPVARLVIGTNSNDILARFFASGAMEAAPVVPTLSPSMDIQVSSNVERLLFDLLGRDGAAVAAAMARFRETGRMALDPDLIADARTLFTAHRCSEEQTLAQMARIHRECGGMLVDPHTAVGLHAARQAQDAGEVEANTPLVALACAHPAKFPDAVAAATGLHPPLPPHLADLHERPERVTRLGPDLDGLKAFVREKAGAA